MQAYRPIALVLLIFSFLVVAIETKSIASGHMSIFDKTISTLFYPFQVLVNHVATFSGELINVGSLKSQNEQLETENALLVRRVSLLESLKVENQNLRKLLEMKTDFDREKVSAEIIARDPSLWFKEFTINRGISDGLTSNLGVVGVGGAVGKIAEVSSGESHVKLLLDPSLAVPVEILPNGAQGIAYGDGASGYVIKYLPHDASIQVGDQVVTSPYGHVFEKGIPVGNITRIEPGEKALFKKAFVKPSVDFNRIQSVLIFKE